ncbi:unnamed protein product [Acidithrix sp. C25]|nr:unnamed protein product [Acidithrix sp. C25]
MNLLAKLGCYCKKPGGHWLTSGFLIFLNLVSQKEIVGSY